MYLKTQLYNSQAYIPRMLHLTKRAPVVRSFSSLTQPHNPTEPCRPTAAYKIIAQRPISIINYMANGLSFLPASSIILNKLISINLCFFTWLWYYQSAGMLLLGWQAGISPASTFLLHVSLQDFSPSYNLTCHRPQQLLQ